MTTQTQYVPKIDDRVEVRGWSGVAWVVDGPTRKWVPETTIITVDEDGEYDPEGEEVEVETGEGEWVPDPDSGQVICHMVGDDRPFTHDITDLILLDEDDYCGCCGQIGCTGDGRDA